MQCFVHGSYGNSDKNNEKHAPFVSFSIPDIGISFKAAFNGKQDECEYTGLLALLEFIDLNPQLFKNKNVEVFTDSFSVVHQVNMKISPNKNLEPYRNMALSYKKKIAYTLNWIAPDDNPAQNIFGAN